MLLYMFSGEILFPKLPLILDNSPFIVFIDEAVIFTAQIPESSTG